MVHFIRPTHTHTYTIRHERVVRNGELSVRTHVIQMFIVDFPTSSDFWYSPDVSQSLSYNRHLQLILSLKVICKVCLLNKPGKKSDNFGLNKLNVYFERYRGMTGT